jgi:hypothetical protein
VKLVAAAALLAVLFVFGKGTAEAASVSKFVPLVPIQREALKFGPSFEIFFADFYLTCTQDEAGHVGLTGSLKVVSDADENCFRPIIFRKSRFGETRAANRAGNVRIEATKRTSAIN